VRVAAAVLAALAAGCLESPPEGGDPVVVIDAEATPDATPCPEAADACVIDPASGHTYAAFSQHLTWAEALAECVEMSWYLATDLGPDESAIIESLLTEAMWIGGSDADVEDDWRWVTGESFDYMHWRSGEPNSGTTVNCMLANWFNEGWNDEVCDTPWAYVCESGPLE
jgi:hypothetical protein